MLGGMNIFNRLVKIQYHGIGSDCVVGILGRCSPPFIPLQPMSPNSQSPRQSDKILESSGIFWNFNLKSTPSFSTLLSYLQCLIHIIQHHATSTSYSHIPTRFHNIVNMLSRCLTNDSVDNFLVSKSAWFLCVDTYSNTINPLTIASCT